MIIYMVARSQNKAHDHYMNGQYYMTLEIAQKVLKEFGKPREKIFEIEIPIREVLYETGR